MNSEAPAAEARFTRDIRQYDFNMGIRLPTISGFLNQVRQTSNCLIDRKIELMLASDERPRDYNTTFQVASGMKFDLRGDLSYDKVQSICPSRGKLLSTRESVYILGMCRNLMPEGSNILSVMKPVLLPAGGRFVVSSRIGAENKLFIDAVEITPDMHWSTNQLLLSAGFNSGLVLRANELGGLEQFW